MPPTLEMTTVRQTPIDTSAIESHALIETPIGPLGLRWRGFVLIGIDLEPAVPDGRDPGSKPPEWIARPLRDYFDCPRHVFEPPLELAGTPFQQRVWVALRAIPAGQTRAYGDIARELGSAARAVGQACRANPCPILVPCHRVIGRHGLGGFAGDTSGRRIAIKRWLLAHEGVTHAG